MLVVVVSVAAALAIAVAASNSIVSALIDSAQQAMTTVDGLLVVVIIAVFAFRGRSRS